ncbi:unnamed protein product [Brassica oleracea var. botrytis]
MEGNTVGMRTFINMLKIIIWWDIENLGVPQDLPPDLVYERKLRDEGFGGDIEIRIVVPFSDCVVPSVLLENMTLCRVNNFPRPTDPMDPLKSDNQISDDYIIDDIQK